MAFEEVLSDLKGGPNRSEDCLKKQCQRSRSRAAFPKEAANEKDGF
jgi:hypothetical protein